MLIVCNDFWYDIQDIKSQQQAELQNLEERKETAIIMVLLTMREQILVQNEYIKNSIKTDLRAAYPNEEQLKTDLINRNEPFVSICANNINYDKKIIDKYSTDVTISQSVFIADKYGIITDNGFVDKGITSRDWASEIDSKENKQLAANAVCAILNQNKDIIYWESDKNVSKYEDSYIITNPDMDNIIKLIKSSNFYALKNYNMLVPSYITDTGDIFGVPDVNEHGLPNDNNKLIIVREINLYDIVSPYRDSFEKYDQIMSRYTIKTDDYIHSKIMTYLFIAIICIISFVLLFIAINRDSIAVVSRGDRNDNSRFINR